MLYRAAQAWRSSKDATIAPRRFSKPLVVSVFATRSSEFALHLHPKKSEQAEQVLREIVESVPVPV